MGNTRRADFIMGIGFMAIGVCVFVFSRGFAKAEKGIGPGDYPRVVAAGLFILGGILSINSFIRGFPKQTEKFNLKAAIRLLIFIAVTVAYVQLMKIFGFIVLTPFYLFFGMYFFGYRKRLVMALTSVLVTAAIHLIFRVIFLVMLPVFRLF